ncbi:MAG TPA: UDP-N-acetylmuramate:L-alanyl-gamma-D-glutamyl-meso-diaminopimelate ligase [Thermodesulfobacteriaceae bacterium]|nr:UDP-N-acetylmuramate:L-alanyl-gamma-D-glutamyl-meso-diaminopimelate ligase [Thermodesulfobacteriaceae bacterium]
MIANNDYDSRRTPRLPPPGSQVYLIGICGTGMAALAGLLKKEGYAVRGSDSQAYPPMSEVLDKLNIPVVIGYNEKNLCSCQPEHRQGHTGDTCLPDLVIIGNVIRADNPEAEFVLGNGIPYLSLPEALALFFLENRKPLLVAGTHGKTTTSTMLVAALSDARTVPGFMIGGMLRDHGTGFNTGTSPWFVLEGDEYDTAFFDKRPKFIHYRPFGVILTSIEFDHADIFNDIREIKQAFSDLIALLPREGVLVACADWPDVMEVSRAARCRVITYGTEKHAQWRLADLEISKHRTAFSAVHQGDRWGRISINLPGRHNALNALATAALGDYLGIKKETITAGLAGCRGVRRRQEIKGEIGGITVIDDFAHHPRAVRETLAALRAAYPGRRLIAVFEPRTNTSRRSVFQDVYPSSFTSADCVLVRAVPDPEKAPPYDRFSSEKLVKDLNGMEIEAHFFPDADHICSYLEKVSCCGDVIVILSNGDFEGLHRKFLSALAAEEPA